MSDKQLLKPIALAVGVALAGSFAAVEAAQVDAGASPFAMSSLDVAYMRGEGEGSCGGDKGGEESEGSCGGDKGGQESEGSCGGDKGGEDSEGSCGGDKAGEAEDKGEEGKCGEGKCGGDA